MAAVYNTNDDQPQQDCRTGLADYFAFDDRVGVAINALSNGHRITADVGIFPEFDAAAHGYGVSAHRAVHHNIAEDGDRIAARTGHSDGAEDADRVANVFVRADGDALKKLDSVSVGFRKRQAGGSHEQNRKNHEDRKCADVHKFHLLPATLLD